jgi:hypothetical protein
MSLGNFWRTELSRSRSRQCIIKQVDGLRQAAKKELRFRGLSQSFQSGDCDRIE